MASIPPISDKRGHSIAALATAPPAPDASTLAERRSLGVFAVLAVLGIAWIAKPVGIGILLGALTAFALQPLYDRLCGYTRRTSFAALGCVLASAAGFGGTLGGLFYLLVARGTVMGGALIASLGPGGAGRGLLERAATRLGPLRLHPDELAARLRDAATDLASRAANIVAVVASATFTMMLISFFLLMTVFFTLERWTELARHAENMFPIRPRYTRALLEEFRRVGRTTLLGTVATGLAQGVLAALGYFLAGVPEAAFFGAVTAVASLIPAVGTALVWVPVGVALIATGSPGHGALELFWGALLVVGVSDYVIRPRLVGGHGTMPALLTFTALFGGVEAFGLIGLILGPIVMALSFGLLRIFAHDAEVQRAAHGGPAG
jgi:predicted PurR-regulated permease PerM